MKVITMAMLKKAVNESSDFDGFIQEIVTLTIKRAQQLGTYFSPDDCEEMANLLYASYQPHYEDLRTIQKEGWSK